MKRKFGYILYFTLLSLLTIATAVLAFLPRGGGNADISELVDVGALESLLDDKYNYMSEKSDDALKIASTKSDSVNVEFFDSLAGDFPEKGIGFFHYERGRLQHWSTNDIPVPVEFKSSLGDRIVRLENGLYLCCIKLTDNNAVVGLYQIRKEYSYENDMLVSAYGRDIDLPAKVSVSADSSENSLSVRLPASDKDIYFSVADDSYLQDRISLPQAMRLSFLLLALALLASVFEVIAQKNKSRSWIVTIVFLSVLMAIRFLLLTTGFFNDLDNLKLFSPELLSTSTMQASFGDMILKVIVIGIGCIFFCRHFNVDASHLSSRKSYRRIASIFFSIFVSAFSMLLIDFLAEIVYDSSIPFNFANLSSPDMYGYIALVVVTVVIFIAIFTVRKIIRICGSLLEIGMILPITLLLFVGYAVFCWLSDNNNVIVQAGLLWLLWSYLLFCQKKGKTSFLFRTVLAIIISLLVAYSISADSMRKEAEAFKVLAYNMSAERDFDVEFNFIGFDSEMRSSTELADAVKEYDFVRADSIIDKIISTKKYLKRYDAQVTICTDNDSLIFEDDEASAGCFEYFRTMLLDYGVVIPNTNFYYLDNNNGRQSYLGVYGIMVNQSEFVKVYIEFNSKIFSEGLGYPDLLLDKRMALKHSDKKFDFARYSKGILVASRGSYKYLFSLAPENDFREYSVSSSNGYRHFKYCPDKENTVILSKRDSGFSNAFIMFFFVLLGIFIVYMLAFAIYRIGHRNKVVTSSLGQRIRAAFIGVLVVSLFLTMVVSVFFIIDTYETRQNELVLDKVHSVAVELEHSLDLANLKNEDPLYVNDMLVYLSNILYVDINIYDVHGVLMSSSRREFFDKGLKGMFMDPSSYRHLIMNKDELFSHKERIDKVEYLSVYLPLKDKSNKVVGYLNLPYFAAEAEVEEEMSNYISVFASIFLLVIFLALIIGLLVSRRVTIPLSMLQNSIRNMEINRAMKINYGSNDEIGLLIDEYNRKVDELAESAQKLATSERESAWREMARQIAHEIRNPLTPMKLRIQYLERAYQENASGWEKMLEQLPQMLIEQIDVLDATASQFSEFAKMQLPQKKEVNLCEVIENIVDLHNGTNGVEVRWECNVDGKAVVMVDRDQILRVFTNLVRNSIQAIPEDRKGEVVISISDDGDRYFVSVRDNGCGIADEIKAKIFQPNFTTKSSGMGLGLSMVKNILFGNGVEIDFDTEVGVGTEFKLYFEKLGK